LLLLVAVAFRSGGNIAFDKRAEVWSRDELSRLPSLDLKFAPTNS
jgi:hypothetical protein